MNHRPSVSIREFARLIGVTHPAVLEAIKSGRLSKSVVTLDEKKSVVVFDDHAAKEQRNQLPATAVRLTSNAASITPGFVSSAGFGK